MANIKGLGSTMKSRFGMMGTLGLMATPMDFMANVKSGDDVGTAAVKTAASTMLWTAAPGVMLATTAASVAPQLAVQLNDAYKQKKDWWQTQFLQGNVGGRYQDTQRAYTMRQAAVNQIQASKLNARSALGGEAQIFAANHHRG